MVNFLLRPPLPHTYYSVDYASDSTNSIKVYIYIVYFLHVNYLMNCKARRSKRLTRLCALFHLAQEKHVSNPADKNDDEKIIIIIIYNNDTSRLGNFHDNLPEKRDSYVQFPLNILSVEQLCTSLLGN